MGASYNDGTPTWVVGHEGRHATQFPYFNGTNHIYVYIYVYIYY